MLARPDFLAIASVLMVGVSAILMGTLYNSRPLGVEKFTAGQNFDVALAVTRAYNNVLDRTPTEAELVEYHNRLVNDDQFDVPSLENALRETGEYRRLMRLQSQSANPGLEGALTEAQVLGKLRGFYRETVGVDPDEATLVFLRERYRRTHLDDEYIQELIKSIANVSAGRKAAGIVAKDGKDGKAGNGGAGKDGKGKDGSGKDGKGGTGKDGANGKDVGKGKHDGDATDDMFENDSKGTKYADALSKLCTKMGIDADSIKTALDDGSISADALLGGICPKDATGDIPPDKMAQFLMQRQIDGAATETCRASRAMQAMELAAAGYVIPPERLGSWTVPQKRPPVCIGAKGPYGPVNSQTALIGTPLDAAQEMEGNLVLF